MPKPPEEGPREAKDCSESSATPTRSCWHQDVTLLSLPDSRNASKKSTGHRVRLEDDLPVTGDMSETSRGDLESLPMESSCLAWLLAWEARQEARQEKLLRRHEESLLRHVEALRRDFNMRGDARRTTARPRLLPGDSSNSLCRDFGATFTNKRWWSEGTCSHVVVRPSKDSGSMQRNLSVPHTSSSMMPRRSRAPEEPENRARALAFKLVHSRGFAMATGAMIFLYTLAVGVMADAEMGSAMRGEEEPWWLWYVDVAFAAAFALEVLLRVAGDGQWYFLGAERNWNVFDVCVAAVGLADIGLGMYTNMGFFRILRACRVIRVLRVMLVFKNCTALRDLQLMTESLFACVPCLGWGLLLLGSLHYIFAVVLLRGAKQEVKDRTLSASSQQVMEQNFCGIRSAVVSLTEAISGGRSWGEFSRPFAEVSPIYGLLFPAFMVFVIFGALNILTGIFVESTSSIAKQNKELAVEEEIARAESAENQIRDFFQDLDSDGSGALSPEELANGLQDPRVKAYFSAVLQIDVGDPHSLFHLLDKDHDGKVSIDEFIEKCLKLRGGARAMDVAMVHKENGMMQKQVKNLMKSIEEVSCRLNSQEFGN